MDYQEAIEVINNHERYVGVKYVNGVEEAYVTTYFEKALSAAISAMQELQEYRRLGTLEEAREAVEKQKRKKPCASNRCYVCPRCGLVTSLRIKHNYCDACGQHIDWSVKE